MNEKAIVLSPRRKYFGWCYKTDKQLRMTGKEWHEYARRQQFKTEHGSDSAWGNKCEVWLDGRDLNGRASV